MVDKIWPIDKLSIVFNNYILLGASAILFFIALQKGGWVSIKTLPLSSLPVTVRDSSGHSHTEDFSRKFGDVLSSMLMRELGATFKDTDGYSLSVVHGCKVEFLEFCSFLASSDKRTIRSLSELTPPLLNDFVEHLKRVSPSKQENGKTTHRWFRRWGTFRSRLAGIIAKEKFPYVQNQQTNATDGHTPYAMGMLIEALQAEIDRIRNKLHVENDGTVNLKWFAAAKRGRVLRLDQIDACTPGKTSALTNDQLDELEKAIFEPDGRSHKQLAKDIGMSGSWLYAVKRDWITKGRLNGRPKAKFNEDDIDLTIDDIIATFSFYLPDWPMVGGMRTVGISYRVYKSKCGVLHNVYKSKEEAESAAKEIGGEFAAVSRDGRIDYSVLNPAERIMVYSAMSKDAHTFIVKKLAELMPGGTNFLRDEYLPTSYDWTVVFLYWLTLTGWNVEAIRSINRLDVLRQIKNGGPNELLSKQHATFSVEIEQEDDDAPTITGEKRRSQPKGRPKLYTHVSDRGEQYGLFRVLQDYCMLTEPFVKYLDGDDVNRILFGFSMASQVSLSILTRSINVRSTKRKTSFPSKNLSYLHNIDVFLKKNKIYEDVDHVIRVMNTTPMQLRVTYFTTLRSMNVPITLLVFLAGHNSEDTHLIHYSSGKHGTKILKERSRKQLNVIADKAFTGSLTPYTQAKKQRSNSTIQIFTHRSHPFMFCTDPYAPTWPDFDEYLKAGADGVTKKACDYFEMCLLCDKCQVTEDTLPYLVRWLGDLHEWRRTKGGGNFPYFMYRRFQAIREVFDLCEADDLWAAKLRKAETIAESDEFDAPPIWRGI